MPRRARDDPRGVRLPSFGRPRRLPAQGPKASPRLPLRTRTMRTIAALLFTAAMALARQEEGVSSLFNGKDLSGWVNVNGAPETWTVREGMIVTTGKPMGVLRSVKM